MAAKRRESATELRDQLAATQQALVLCLHLLYKAPLPLISYEDEDGKMRKAKQTRHDALEFAGDIAQMNARWWLLNRGKKQPSMVKAKLMTTGVKWRVG